MTYEEKWAALKEDMYQAVDEGYDKEHFSAYGTEDFGRFVAYRYVYEKMCEMDGEYDDDE